MKTQETTIRCYNKERQKINRRNKIKQEEKYGRLLQAMFKSNKYKPTTYYRKVCKLKKRLDTLSEQYGAEHITRADYRRDYEKALAELLEMGIAMNAIVSFFLNLYLPARNLTQDEKDALITSGLVVQRVYNGKTYLVNNLFHCGLGNDD